MCIDGARRDAELLTTMLTYSLQTGDAILQLAFGGECTTVRQRVRRRREDGSIERAQPLADVRTAVELAPVELPLQPAAELADPLTFAPQLPPARCELAHLCFAARRRVQRFTVGNLVVIGERCFECRIYPPCSTARQLTTPAIRDIL